VVEGGYQGNGYRHGDYDQPNLCDQHSEALAARSGSAKLALAYAR